MTNKVDSNTEVDLMVVVMMMVLMKGICNNFERLDAILSKDWDCDLPHLRRPTTQESLVSRNTHVFPQ